MIEKIANNISTFKLFQKNNSIFLVAVFFSVQSTELCSSRKELTTVYSHGFGESSYHYNGPTYSDAGGKWYKARFCTQEPVHLLAEYLKKVVNGSNNGVYLDSLSCGAGTALICLSKLANYESDTAYFQGTSIKQKDAQNIINAINGGGVRLSLPFLSIKKTVPVALAADFLSLCTFAGVIYWCLLHFTLFAAPGRKYGKVKGILCSTLAIGLYYKNSLEVKDLYSSLIDILVVPCLTSFHYNPFHIKPIDAVEGLRGKITCPVLIQCSSDDGLVVNDDIWKVYDVFKAGNKNNVYISVSDAHTHFNYFEDKMHMEIKKYFERYVCNVGDMADSRCLVPDIIDRLQSTTVEELKRRIASRSWISWLWANVWPKEVRINE